MSNTWAEVDLAALRHNIDFVRNRVGKGVEVMAVVKADGYGHGAVEIVNELVLAGIRWYGVANTVEGMEIRSVDPKIGIMILGQVFPENIKDLIKNRLTPIVCDYYIAELLNKEACRINRTVPVHVKIDTGMGRIGVWHEDFGSFVKDLKKLKNLDVEGFLSHFPSSDDDAGFSLSQIKIFRSAAAKAEKENIRVKLLHIANSAAILKLPSSYFDMVRPGIILYGLHPSADFNERYDIRPVLSLKTRISFIKEVKSGMTISYGRTHKIIKNTRIATITAGYGDGYNRHLSGRGRVLIRGEYAPIVGRVTMDQTMVDVGHIPDAKAWDEVVLIGRHGANEITVEEIAKLIGTIPYEVVCGINKRVQRIYLNGNVNNDNRLRKKETIRGVISKNGFFANEPPLCS